MQKRSTQVVLVVVFGWVLTSSGCGSGEQNTAQSIPVVKSEVLKRLSPSVLLLQSPNPSSPQNRYRVGVDRKDLSKEDCRELLSIEGLAELDLHGCQLAPEAFSDCTPGSAFQTLRLVGGNVSCTTYRNIGLLKSLSSLWVEGATFDDCCLGVLDKSKLDKLDLFDTSITEKGLEALPAIKSLRIVTIKSDHLDTKSFGSIAEILPNLQELGLNCKKIDSSIGPLLEKCERLETLHLGGTEVDDSVLPHLAKLRSLKMVFLGASRVTKDGVKSLNSSRPDVYVLH